MTQKGAGTAATCGLVEALAPPIPTVAAANSAFSQSYLGNGADYRPPVTACSLESVSQGCQALGHRPSESEAGSEIENEISVARHREVAERHASNSISEPAPSERRSEQ